MTAWTERVDPDLRDGLEVYRALGFADVPLDASTLPDLRSRPARVLANFTPPPLPESVALEILEPGESGPPVGLRVLRPAGPPTALKACILSIHSGGMVMGDAAQDDATLAALVAELDCVAVSVDYRLAPEHPFPAGADDCFAALEWVVANGARLGVDPARVVVMGSSGGGGLAASACLRARDRGGPHVSAQILIAPMLDDRNDTASSLEFRGIPSWSREYNLAAWTMVLGERASTTEISPYAAPSRAKYLAGLPPTFLQVGELEVFRDEVVDYAVRLLRGEVPCELHVYPGVFHGSELMAPTAARSRQSTADRLAALRRVTAPHWREHRTPAPPGLEMSDVRPR